VARYNELSSRATPLTRDIVAAMAPLFMTPYMARHICASAVSLPIPTVYADMDPLTTKQESEDSSMQSTSTSKDTLQSSKNCGFFSAQTIK
jgi:hypothetical protein